MNGDSLPGRRAQLLILLVVCCLVLTVLGLPLRVAEPQVINTGPLFISSNEIVTIDDDFIQADRTQQTTNQGTLLISGTLRFVNGVINEVGGVLHGGWRGQAGTPQSRPDFHTIFRANARSENPSAVLDGGGTDTLIDGPVRRIGGGNFVFPTGDVSEGQAYRGLLGLEAPIDAADVDVLYFWRDGLMDFGTRMGTLLLRVTDREYWRVWSDEAIDVSPMYERSSDIDSLLDSTQQSSLTNLTLAGWDGTQWVDLNGQASSRASLASGFVTSRLNQPRDFLALTFALRLEGDGDSDRDGVSNDKEWDADGDGQGPDDSDGDGTPDYLDTDDDNDGFLTRDEDYDRSGSPYDDDRDGDGIPDYLDPAAGDAVRLWVTKSASRETLSVGDSVVWTLTVENRSSFAVILTLIDVLPTGLAVDPDVLRIEAQGDIGLPAEENLTSLRHPSLEQSGLVVHWPDLELAAGETQRLQFRTEATIGLDAGNHTNFAYAIVGNGPARAFSNLASQTFAVQHDQQLDCATVIGRAFNDKNANGKLDPLEPGIAGVRLGEPSGLVIRTDDQGRFHLPCEVVQQDFGKNLVLKLDKRTLPAGFEMTSENPRVVRLTQGKMLKANFGAALSQEVTLNISDCTFMAKGRGDVLHPQWNQVLTQLIRYLDQRPSRLVIDYTGGPNLRSAQMNRRFELVKSAVSKAWKAKPRRYELTMSVRARRLVGTEELACHHFVLPPEQAKIPYSKAAPHPATLQQSTTGIKPARGSRFFAATRHNSR